MCTQIQSVLNFLKCAFSQANQCQGDRLSVSLSGNSNFEDAHNYCGQGTLSLVSNANRIAIGMWIIHIQFVCKENKIWWWVYGETLKTKFRYNYLQLNYTCQENFVN